ncbi:MAG: antitoxin MazE family protein [Mycobacteriaceae bacterium]|nr:antitoxin MazE family protein [Mycobacteriaceae bacterium]
MQQPFHATLRTVSTSTRRARQYRERMRLRGYRPVQVWVPDVRSTAFAAEAHREAVALAEADRHSDDMEFVEAISALGSLDDDA